LHNILGTNDTSVLHLSYKTAHSEGPSLTETLLRICGVIVVSRLATGLPAKISLNDELQQFLKPVGVPILKSIL
jgi:hypothetical protein